MTHLIAVTEKICYCANRAMITLAKQRLLIIAPHPDDEVIGCGGLIKRVKDEGGKVYVLFLTVGDTRDFSQKGKSTINERQKEIEKVAKFLKFDDYHIAFSGNDYHLKLDLLGQKALMDIIERESPVSIEKIKPNIVTFPNAKSYNQDHRIAAEATHAALRPAPKGNKYFVETALSYEEAADYWNLSELAPMNFFVPLTKDELVAKLKAVELYTSQLRSSPNLRSLKAIETLATLRGGLCATEFAEGYVLHRGIF